MIFQSSILKLLGTTSWKKDKQDYSSESQEALISSESIKHQSYISYVHTDR